MDFEEICEEYGVTREDILACLDYAAKMIESEQVYMI